MAKDQAVDAAKALEYKEKGNKCFQAGDYSGAEAYYTNAINSDPTNPLLYTNRAMALLKLLKWDPVISDSLHAITLLPANMKAYYYLAQAQIALSQPGTALSSALKAHELCVHEIKVGGKGGASLGVITELVLRCKKEDWERREKEKGRRRGAVQRDLMELMERERERALAECLPEEKQDVEREWDDKIEGLRLVFEASDPGKRQPVPDWIVDDITFSVMVDPVVTKTGQSYERASIMEHLKRSPTDPLTREPLKVEDLRPNLALRAACDQYLHENGWAVDW